MDDVFQPKKVKIYDYAPDIKEVIEIDHLGFGKKGGRKAGTKADEVSEEDRERTLKRIKKNVRRLALANDMGQIHLVLTYAENQENYEKVLLSIKK